MHEGGRVAHDDDAPPRASEGDVGPAPVRDEANGAAVVRPHGGDDDELLLAPLKEGKRGEQVQQMQERGKGNDKKAVKRRGTME